MLTYGSLFSGVGGFELGFNKLGWQCKWMCEKDPYARSVLTYHWGDKTIYEDVTTLSSPQPVDIICGGFPCQDLSSAGLKSGFNGDKSVLFYEFVRIVKEMREATNGEYPRAVIWENVQGITNSKKSWINDVYAAWAEIGAVVQEHRLIDAKDFGVSQRRKRVIGTAIFDPGADCGREILLESETGFGHLRKIGGPREDSAGTPQDGAYQLSEVIAFDTSQITSIHNRCKPMPGDPTMPLTANGHWPKLTYSLAPVYGQGSTLQGSEAPISNSLTAIDAPDRGTRVVDKQLLRKFTEVELERLMGWPDNHTQYGIVKDKIKNISASQRRKMCGNGLVAPVAEWAGRRVEIFLNSLSN